MTDKLEVEVREWLPTTPDGKTVDAYTDDLAERLERLLRRVELEAYMAGEHSFAPYSDGAADARILAALKDENDGD